MRARAVATDGWHGLQLVFFRMWGDGASRVAVSGLVWGEEESGVLGVDSNGVLHLLHHEPPSPNAPIPSKAIMAGGNILAASQVGLGESYAISPVAGTLSCWGEVAMK